MHACICSKKQTIGNYETKTCFNKNIITQLTYSLRVYYFKRNQNVVVEYILHAFIKPQNRYATSILTARIEGRVNNWRTIALSGISADFMKLQVIEYPSAGTR